MWGNSRRLLRHGRNLSWQQRRRYDTGARKTTKRELKVGKNARSWEVPKNVRLQEIPDLNAAELSVVDFISDTKIVSVGIVNSAKSGGWPKFPVPQHRVIHQTGNNRCSSVILPKCDNSDSFKNNIILDFLLPRKQFCQVLVALSNFQWRCVDIMSRILKVLKSYIVEQRDSTSRESVYFFPLKKNKAILHEWLHFSHLFPNSTRETKERGLWRINIEIIEDVTRGLWWVMIDIRRQEVQDHCVQNFGSIDDKKLS